MDCAILDELFCLLFVYICMSYSGWVRGVMWMLTSMRWRCVLLVVVSFLGGAVVSRLYFLPVSHGRETVPLNKLIRSSELLLSECTGKITIRRSHIASAHEVNDLDLAKKIMGVIREIYMENPAVLLDAGRPLRVAHYTIMLQTHRRQIRLEWGRDDICCINDRILMLTQQQDAGFRRRIGAQFYRIYRDAGWLLSEDVVRTGMVPYSDIPTPLQQYEQDTGEFSADRSRVKMDPVSAKSAEGK